ncbi:hypothetical protein [Streptomyces olivochromogenes]|uniref:hypothetical protein n=1 Tax=Streptomyces olivochromogenes TaxID=1963 RepID=UPI001F3F3E9B|nr:hypothetical protein [Streptomyces olivochromogenes]MCF3130455.1 hypothetical protein [Streptomyces olivochromogenes]
MGTDTAAATDTGFTSAAPGVGRLLVPPVRQRLTPCADHSRTGNHRTAVELGRNR